MSRKTKTQKTTNFRHMFVCRRTYNRITENCLFGFVLFLCLSFCLGCGFLVFRTYQNIVLLCQKPIFSEACTREPALKIGKDVGSCS